MNCSDRTLSEPEKRVLAKGLNYSVAPKKFPVANNITATENACKNLSSEKASQLRATVCSMLRKPANLKVEQNLDRSERKALRNLKNNKSVTILPAEKGRCAVVMNTEEYVSKCKDLLHDESTYVKLS